MKKWGKYICTTLLLTLLIGFILPQSLEMPVERATSGDYNKDSFWFYPWGRSVTHKGVDIFAPKGRKVMSSTNGFVLFTGQFSMGGNVVLILGPKWRLHYYAHLNDISVKRFSFVCKNSQIGSVGDSGNAAGKPPHLHYSIFTPVPYVWRIDQSPQGYLKMFYLNPIEYLVQH